MSEPATIETVNKAIDEYKSPSVTLGMIVLWYQNAKNMTEKEGGWDHTEQNKALQALVAFRRPKPDPEPKS
jgi:hypothetical protein